MTFRQTWFAVVVGIVLMATGNYVVAILGACLLGAGLAWGRLVRD